MMGAELVPITSESFNQLTRLTAREDFMILADMNASDLKHIRRIGDSHNGIYEEFYLLGCNAV
jgi:hypothetical protein